MTFDPQITFIQTYPTGILLQIQDECVQRCVWVCTTVCECGSVQVYVSVCVNMSLASFVNLLTCSFLHQKLPKGRVLIGSIHLFISAPGMEPPMWQIIKCFNEWMKLGSCKKKTEIMSLTCDMDLDQSLSHVWLFVTPWTVAHQAPLPTEFSRHEYWSW